MKSWWQIGIPEIAKQLETNADSGLGLEDAGKRLDRFGPNRLEEKKGRSPFRLFLEQFQGLIIWILIGAALVSGFLKEWIDAFAIIGIVCLNAILGFIQGFRAEKSLAALRKLSSPLTKVFREGARILVPSADLVPGDLIELEAGDHIPADCRISWLSSNFSVQEASLTGESVPTVKTGEVLKKENIPLGDRANMVYTGTSVVSGKARALVVETAMNTELGKIAGLIQSSGRETTPLQRKLDQFGRWLVFLCLGLVAVIFFLEWLRGGRFVDIFLTSVSLAVAAIPEGLPAVVTIALALGVQRMVKRNALIRKLPSVETLGCATVICSDKTGTLTRNEMTVQAVYAGRKSYRVTGIGYSPDGEIHHADQVVNLKEHSSLLQALKCGILCNGARLVYRKDGWAISGDPTEAALLTAAAKAGLWLEREEKTAPFVDEIPFDSERKRMSVIREAPEGQGFFVKGAPDMMLDICTAIDIDGRIEPLSAEEKKHIHGVINRLAQSAMRVLALAYRYEPVKTGRKWTADSVEKNLIFAGLAAMIDPPREEVRQAMVACQTAGIRPVMITGDHQNTAVAIAKDLGFFGQDSQALTGEELDKIPDGEFPEKVGRIPVYARVSPEHKLRIVKAWKSLGHVVAMTGDGVNDAPAVKEADIGVAMGITGTDVTKEVSDMVITDDNFASIIAAVEEGRGIYDNIKKFIHYLLSCNAGEILVMFVSSLTRMPIPLLPIHILWVNLVTDGLPALALGVEPVDETVMRQPPRRRDEGVLNRQTALTILLQGAFIALCSLAAFYLVYYVEKQGIERARTASFIVLSVSQLYHAFNCRSTTESIFKIGFFTNKKLISAFLVSFSLQVGAVSLPWMKTIFKTESLSLIDWTLVLVISSFPLWAMEVVKAVRRMKRGQPAGSRVIAK
ncbi:calcium-translocating P-type ATPase, SERCA-type [bacterium]|nr:calcium-translocating P-type ATPase, SERCA-type [bacterium]